MQLYAILGFAVAMVAFAIWLAIRFSRNAKRVERAEHKAAAHKAANEAAEAASEWTRAERDRQLEAAARIRQRIANGANKPTEPILPSVKKKSGAGLLLLVCLPLALCTGCTRTVYVDAKPPEIPVEIEVPMLEDSKEDWQVFGLTLLETINRYNEEWAQ